MNNRVFGKNSLYVGLAAALFAVGPVSNAADSINRDTVIELDIAAQNISQAIGQLSSKSGVQIVLSKDVVGADVNVQSLHGAYRLSDALEAMLEGTGLIYQFSSDDAVLIRTESESPDGSDEKKGSDDVEEEIVVTGSLIRGAKTTANVVTIDSEYISKRGFTSAEQILAAIPQNQSIQNSSFTLLEPGSIDTGTASAANLRGLGRNATLILINGRRTTSSAVFGDGTVNLNTIPAHAVERVEIFLDGASSIYGADAVGGVINFILKDGAELPDTAITQVRYGDDSNGGASYRISQSFNVGWDGGSLAVNLSHDQTDPVENEKVGFTTQDFRELGGFTDRRSPGNIIRSLSFMPLGALPADDDGTVPLTAEDLDVGGPTDSGRLGEPIRFSNIRPYAAADTRNSSASIRFSQDITDSLDIFADAIYSKNHTNSLATKRIFNIEVPNGSAFNQSGQSVFVGYSFHNEHDLGLPREVRDSKTEAIDLTAGFNWDLANNSWQMNGYVNFNEEEGAFRIIDEVPVQFFSDPADYVLLVAAVSDPNPATALNLFGNGTAQNLDTLNSVLATKPFSITASSIEAYDLKADGDLFSLPAGELRLALNANYRTEEIDYSNASFPTRGNGFAYVSPVFERDVIGVNAELAIPILENLDANLSVRWEESTVEGAFDPDQPGVNVENKYSSTVPRLGVRWQPVEDVTIKASFSESFRAPGLANLFEDPGPAQFMRTIDDPFDPSGPVVDAPFLISVPGNPDLQPENADTLSVGIEWQPGFLPGLLVSATYNKVEFDNAIITTGDIGDWNALLVEANAGNLPPGIVVRNPATGALEEIRITDFNAAEVISETVDFDIQYTWDTSYGGFSAALSGTYTGTRDLIVLQDSPAISTDNQDNGPLRWKSTASLNWTRDNFGLNLFADFDYGYTNRVNRFGTIFPTKVSHQVIYDMTGYYDLTDSDIRLSGGILNILNPGFDLVERFNTPFDAGRYNVRGRTIYFEVQKTFDL